MKEAKIGYDPKPGQKYWMPDGIARPAETRHVVERKSGRVYYISGRKTQFARVVQVSLAVWCEWVRYAKQVS